jgi:L-malate glycosyltransferase
LRILHISSARSFGGGERHLADLATALALRGHEVYAALPPGSPLEKELLALPSGRIFHLGLRWGALDIRSALELGRSLRDHKIELLHAHMGRDYPLAALAAARAPGVKLIVTRHVLFRLNRLHALTFRRVARVIAVSRAVERSLVAQNIFPAQKIRVIPNGIDFARFDRSLRGFDRAAFRQGLKIPPHSLLVGSIGSLKRQKGHEDFLRAAAIITREKSEAHFVIAGADETRAGAARDELERRAIELGLRGRLHLPGRLDDIAPFLSALDVYVSASHTESFGLAIVEAMGMGLPVVATATEGAREIIEGEEAALLVAVSEHEKMAASVLRLLDNEDERLRLGQLARAHARARFGLERMVEETEKIYLETVGTKARRGRARA